MGIITGFFHQKNFKHKFGLNISDMSVTVFVFSDVFSSPKLVSCFTISVVIAISPAAAQHVARDATAADVERTAGRVAEARSVV